MFVWIKSEKEKHNYFKEMIFEQLFLTTFSVISNENVYFRTNKLMFFFKKKIILTNRWLLDLHTLT